MTEFDTTILAKLNQNDLQKLQQVINEMVEQKNNKPKRSRKKSKSTTKSVAQISTETSVEKPLPAQRRTRKKRRDNNNRASNKKKVCRSEPIDIHAKRPNIFLTEGLDTLPNDEREKRISRLLVGDNVPTARGEFRMIDVKCRTCGGIYSVSRSVVYKDDDGWVYTCDKCQREKH